MLPTLGVIFTFLILWYLGRPLLVLSMGRHPVRYTLVPGSERDWRAILWEPATKLFDEFSQFGYHPVASSNIGGTHASLFFVVLHTHESEKTATVMIGTSDLGTQLAMAFQVRFSDGTSVSLTNSVNAPVYPSWDKHLVFRMPGVRSVGFLSDTLDRLVDSLGNRNPIKIDPEAELAVTEREMNEQLEYLIEIGIVEKQTRVDGRKYTVKGAYRASLSQMWPINEILLWRERRRTLRQIDA